MATYKKGFFFNNRYYWTLRHVFFCFWKGPVHYHLGKSHKGYPINGSCYTVWVRQTQIFQDCSSIWAGQSKGTRSLSPPCSSAQILPECKECLSLVLTMGATLPKKDGEEQDHGFNPIKERCFSTVETHDAPRLVASVFFSTFSDNHQVNYDCFSTRLCFSMRDYAFNSV